MSDTRVFRITVTSQPPHSAARTDTHLVTGEASMSNTVAGYKGRRGWAGRTLSISVEELVYTAVPLPERTWKAKP
jgi:hypothetical protein